MIKAKGAVQTVLLHRRMNDCRLRIVLVKLWYSTALEERDSAAPVVSGRIGGVSTLPNSSETFPR